LKPAALMASKKRHQDEPDASSGMRKESCPGRSVEAAIFARTKGLPLSGEEGGVMFIIGQ
jgi:hypothetical protein